MRRQATKPMSKSTTLGSVFDAQGHAEGNMFAQAAIFERENQAPDREKPRANLYNVIKRLRENSVSEWQSNQLLLLLLL